MAPFPPFVSIKADYGAPSAPASAPFSAHVWKHPQLMGTGSGCPHPGLGTQRNNTAVSEQVYTSCKADVGGGTHCPPATTQMKPGPAEAWRPRKRQLQLPDANLILPLLPQVTGQRARMAPGGKLLEHSSPRWTRLLPLSQGLQLQPVRSYMESHFHTHVDFFLIKRFLKNSYK